MCKGLCIWKKEVFQASILIQQKIACWKSAIALLEHGVKYVQT